MVGSQVAGVGAVDARDFGGDVDVHPLDFGLGEIPARAGADLC